MAGDKQAEISAALDKKVKLTGVSEKLGDMIREIKIFGDKIKKGDPAKRKAGLKLGGRAGLKGGTFPGDFENFTKSKEFKERKDKSHKGEVKAFKKYRERTATTRDEAKTQKMAKGGRAGFKSGSKGCKLAMKGKGRAYGKNS